MCDSFVVICLKKKITLPTVGLGEATTKGQTTVRSVSEEMSFDRWVVR